MRAKSFFHVCAGALLLTTSFSLGAPRARAQAPDAPSAEAEKATIGRINVSAGLIYNNGDVKPAARVPLFLLDKRAMAYLERVGNRIPPKELKHYPGATPADRALGLFRQCVRFERYNKKSAACAQAVRESLLVFATATTKTDFDGKAVFDSLPPENYSVFAEITTKKVNRVSGGLMDDPHFWFVPVAVAGGPRDLVLDNDSLW